MPLLTALVFIIALTLIAGPGAGTFVLVVLSLLSMPWLCLLLAGIAGILVLISFDALWMLCWLGGVMLFLLLCGACVSAGTDINTGHNARHSYDVLERKRIGDSNLYEDKYGRKWHKVAGVFRLYASRQSRT